MTDHLGRWFVSIDAFVVGTAALTSAGVLVRGYEHRKAEATERVIALVLLASISSPPSTRVIGLGAQVFALAGTLVGPFTIAIGTGPGTALDPVLHAAMIALPGEWADHRGAASCDRSGSATDLTQRAREPGITSCVWEEHASWGRIRRF
jgi:hypothetical protein